MFECDCINLEFVEYGMDNKLYRCTSCNKLHILRLNREVDRYERKHKH